MPRRANSYFWLSTEQTVAAARAAVVHMMPLLPTVRLPLPPIIVAEPYSARGGSGEGGEGGAGGAGGSTVVGVPMGGMVLGAPSVCSRSRVARAPMRGCARALTTRAAPTQWRSPAANCASARARIRRQPRRG